MLLRIILNRLGILQDKSTWDLQDQIDARISAYKENAEKKEVKSLTGPMIILHKLNHEEITVNTGQIQTIEKMGENALIIFVTGNRMIVVESSETIRKLIKDSK